MNMEIKEHYCSEMNRIKMSDKCEERILSATIAAERQSPSFRKRKKIRIVPALIASFIAITLMSTAVFADNIKNYISDMFAKNSELIESSIVYPEIQVDEPWAIIKVEEIAADGITYKAIVSVEILDINENPWPETNPNSFISMQPVYDDDNSHQGSYFAAAGELTEYRTENKRFFSTSISAASDAYGSNTVKITLSLFGKTEVVLESYESIEVKKYALDGSLAPDKYYEPASVKISPLSLIISGYDKGMYEYVEVGGVISVESVLVDERINSLYLLYNDGTRSNLLGGDPDETAIVCSYRQMEPIPQSGDLTLEIYSTGFWHPVDITRVIGIELDGVFYSFE